LATLYNGTFSLSEFPPLQNRPKAYSYIRMSTATQLKGDSRRRQEEKSKKYAEEHGLVLVEDYADIGVSAFRGRNVESGALGAFLKRIEDGAIAKGSYLLVESFDRLSRQKIAPALSLFLDIINAGIVVVTLIDGSVYEKDKFDLQQVMYSIMVMSRAYDESLTKSERLRSAWAQKRKATDVKKLTSRGPAWLILDSSRSGFVIDQAKATVVRHIFDQSINGIGIHKIAANLNKIGTPPFGRARVWNNSSVEKILDNRAVFGEFQPHTFLDGKREPVGDAISGYFPTIIDEDTFYRAKAAKTSRRVGASGRKGKLLTNLFSGIAKCGYCGASMHYINKGQGPKGGTYLMCGDAVRGLSCDQVAWRYEHIEASFLAFVEELDLPNIVRSRTDVADLEKLEADHDTLRGRDGELQSRIDRLLDFISKNDVLGDDTQRLISEITIEKGLNASKLAEIQREISVLRHQIDVLPTKNELSELIAAIRDTKNPDLYTVRSLLHSKLRSLTGIVQIMGAGERPLFLRRIRKLEQLNIEQEGLLDDVIARARQLQDLRRIDKRFFTALLPDKVTRIVWPHPDNPLELMNGIYADKARLVQQSDDLRRLFETA
jgi:DNA invertase Pin-like site-specific DNA recombinase